VAVNIDQISVELKHHDHAGRTTSGPSGADVRQGISITVYIPTQNIVYCIYEDILTFTGICSFIVSIPASKYLKMRKGKKGMKMRTMAFGEMSGSCADLRHPDHL
jgi:hypothetical protein